MSVYTVTKNFLENLHDRDKKYVLNLLLLFVQENPFKIAVDKGGIIIDLYWTTAVESPDVTKWLEWMSHKPKEYFEDIDVEFGAEKDEEYIFLKLCSLTKCQKKIIVDSHQFWNKYEGTMEEGTYIIIFDGIEVTALDRDEAYTELNKPKQNTTKKYIDMSNKVNIKGGVKGSAFNVGGSQITQTVTNDSNDVDKILSEMMKILNENKGISQDEREDIIKDIDTLKNQLGKKNKDKGFIDKAVETLSKVSPLVPMIPQLTAAISKMFGG
ncbi:MAG: hypothetical protein K1X86_11360 [Ignavibacteria bacterium]|nr:hypothetical protein [Ignavibacteria bacterium]